jgi:HEPN domain-containing protein
MGEFTRDPTHWLRKHSPDEWIRASLGELSRAERAWTSGNLRAGTLGVKRAAGMALNAALIVEPDPGYGRTYVEHLEALAVDSRVPEAVRAASRRVLDARGPATEVIRLRTPREHTEAFEAARDVIAHAWAVAKRHEAPAG